MSEFIVNGELVHVAGRVALVRLTLGEMPPSFVEFVVRGNIETREPGARVGAVIENPVRNTFLQRTRPEISLFGAAQDLVLLGA